MFSNENWERLIWQNRPVAKWRTGYYTQKIWTFAKVNKKEEIAKNKVTCDYMAERCHVWKGWPKPKYVQKREGTAYIH